MFVFSDLLCCLDLKAPADCQVSPSDWAGITNTNHQQAKTKRISVISQLLVIGCSDDIYQPPHSPPLTPFLDTSPPECGHRSQMTKNN